MTYSEALDWLYATQQFGIKLGLEQPRRLLRETLGFPSAKTKVIHVAGTNGKGSTCAILNALARSCGVRTGLFTSPHLVDFRERIQVSGQHIPEATTAKYLDDLKRLCADWEHHPTFFELTLAVAMRHFRQQECELILLETGMGGRLDATTAVPADLAVITPIAMDHSQWLGETLEEIAAEKAGIIVPKKPVLSSRQDPAARHVIEQEANECRAPLEFITEPLSGYHVNIPGPHQKDNAALALAAAHSIGLPLNADTVRHALSTVTWPGRFERLEDHPIILDATHNPHAAKALVSTWNEVYPNQKASLVFGAVEGKNTEEVLDIIAPIAKHIHLTPVNSPRSLSPEDLVQALPAGAPPHTLHESLDEAIKKLSPAPHTGEERGVNDPILITGSLFLIGQAKAILAGESTRSSSQ
ncbi:bifunctional folylpolyglutamate synthase/dihydrofolate synthase [Verrucomicrobiaceae bacterium N1E253]|uniref:Dihydrofolate synthase/folylpolyglutamate synthase n=1 Tax=Oceaniferula marina TaxID=2748318 RepID=A0A851GMA3_9BACT|nr:folylpolyglutamate synthase/dihydrofolate synthase family protein [Oceaniferula marina]NWK56275.1 bifunctional folylpolyglutamate synthase/dihydrofolate synthase [Oceaniferula marina]